MGPGAAEFRVSRFEDPHVFKERVMPCLIENEAQNCVIFGVLGRFAEAGLRREAEVLPLMLAAEDGNGHVVAVGTMTPRFPILLSPSPAGAAIGKWIAQNGVAIAGVTGEATTAQAFATTWSHSTGRPMRLDTRLGVYQLDQLVAPRAVEGTFRQALIRDLNALLPFAEMFYREIREPLTNPEVHLRRAIDEGRLFVWCNPRECIVSMAAYAGPTPTGVRVNFVFTPSPLRGRGYASNCVAALTHRLLEFPARKRIYLFTDVSNPTSNRIYQAIGYRYLGEQHKILVDHSR
jgi:predicted GNAT family acetyltransferase